MSTKNEFFFAICVGLLILVAAGLEVAYAIKPLIPDPSEGWIYIGDVQGDWNWGISANITAHWTWVTGNPGHYIFDEWTHHGHRWGGVGVWYIEDMKFWWRYDGRNDGYGTTSGADISIPKTGQTHMINSTAWSKFQNWLGTTWSASATIQTSI